MLPDHDRGPFVLYNDSALRELMQPGTTHRRDSDRPAVASLADIYMPSREISDALIEYDRHWNSWVHCATEYPRFQEQHDLRIEATAADIQGDNVGLPWLAVYLSVVCVSDAARKATSCCAPLYPHLIILTGIAHNDER
jgi:hypothetical protein